MEEAVSKRVAGEERSGRKRAQIVVRAVTLVTRRGWVEMPVASIAWVPHRLGFALRVKPIQRHYEIGLEERPRSKQLGRGSFGTLDSAGAA
jgi:hypothetical protein